MVRVVLTYLAYCAVYTCRKPVSVVKPTLEAELGFATSALAGIDSAWLVAYAIGQFCLGATRSVFSGRAIVASAFALTGITTAACASCRTETAFALAWGLNGFFQASINPLLVLFVADSLPPSRRASGVGLWQTSQQVGGVFANLMAASLLAHRGWQPIFLRGGLLVLCFAPLTYFALTSPKLVAPLASPVKSQKKKRFSFFFKGKRRQEEEEIVSVPEEVKVTMTMPGVKATCLAYFCVKMTRYCLMFWLPFFLARAAHMPVAAAARTATWLDVGGVLGSVAAGVVADRVFKGAMLKTCGPFALLASFFLVVLGFGYDRGASLKNSLLMFLVGFCVAAPDGVLGGAAAKNICDYNRAHDAKLPAAVSGLINGCGSLGAILQGLATAALVAKFGWQALFLTLATLMAIASLFLLPAIQLEAQYLSDHQEKQQQQQQGTP